MVVAQIVKVRNNTLRTFNVTPGDLFYKTSVDGQPIAEDSFKVPPGFDQVTEGLTVPWQSVSTTGLEITEASSGACIRCVVGSVETEGDNRDWLQFRNADWVRGRLCSESWSFLDNPHFGSSNPVTMLGKQKCSALFGPAVSVPAGGYAKRLTVALWHAFSAGQEPVDENRWIPLGQRHLLGAVGSAQDLALTFRDGRDKSDPDLPFRISEVIHFENPMKAASPNTVFLNIFDLASSLSIPNSMLCNTMFNTLGAFHAAIEVYGEEWAFYRTPNPTSCGVCKSLKPRYHPVHVYRQSVNLGNTNLKDWEVRYLIRGKLAAKWPGGTYELLRRNCIHFCQELALALGVSPVPGWVRGLHETGASIFQMPWPLSAVHSALFGKAITNGRGEDGEDQDATSNIAATDATFTSATSLARAPSAPSGLVTHWQSPGPRHSTGST
ncbi:unnamed protein product [Effrenium voratum]|nr:unnamed protein product [Effrenium voratum]